MTVSTRSQTKNRRLNFIHDINYFVQKAYSKIETGKCKAISVILVDESGKFQVDDGRYVSGLVLTLSIEPSTKEINAKVRAAESDEEFTIENFLSTVPFLEKPILKINTLLNDGSHFKEERTGLERTRADETNERNLGFVDFVAQ